MGTRVDFYVGRGEQAEWLGSYPFDGYPVGVFEDAAEMFASPLPTEQEWREWVARWLRAPAAGPRSTLPEHGWPWPWKDSRTTDYAYAWEAGLIWGSSFGYEWFRVDPEAENYGEVALPDDAVKTAVFPDMTARQAVTYGDRSGLIVVEVPIGGPPDA